MDTPVRLAVIVSHPIQHFAPWHREVAKLDNVHLRVLFSCDWGVQEYRDPGFGRSFAWDIPLLEGYDHEFLPIARRPDRLDFRSVDNPRVSEFLDRFDPDVVQVFGYAHRTSWRVAHWARRKQRPLLLFSDSHGGKKVSWMRTLFKEVVVRYFYTLIAGALYVGDNNRAYHLRYGLPPERLFPGVMPIDRNWLLGRVPDVTASRHKIRRRHGIPDNAFVVMFCGKYVHHKRPGDLLLALSNASATGRGLWALLVGDGPLREELDDARRCHGIRNAVLTGFVNQSEVPEYYVAADVLAVTSELDAHPLAVTEGATFGLAVVASDRVGCVGPNDTARPDVNALVYPCGDIGALRAAIDRLAQDRALLKTLSKGSMEISVGQDVRVAAKALRDAAVALRRLGTR